MPSNARWENISEEGRWPNKIWGGCNGLDYFISTHTQKTQATRSKCDYTSEQWHKGNTHTENSKILHNTNYHLNVSQKETDICTMFFVLQSYNNLTKHNIIWTWNAYVDNIIWKDKLYNEQIYIKYELKVSLVFFTSIASSFYIARLCCKFIMHLKVLNPKKKQREYELMGISFICHGTKKV